MAVVAEGACVGVVSVWVAGVRVDVVGKVVLVIKLGVLVYVGKNGNDVRVAWVA
jgi:hypothetical protein